MPTVTVSTLIDRARATADMRDNFVTPTQWTTWATQERLALDLFIARSGWTLPLSDFNITVTGSEAGSFSVNPTGGVLAILCVYEYDPSGRIRMLTHNDALSFLRATPGYSGGTRGNSRFYRTQWAGEDLTLNVYPEPTSGETYRVVYVAHPKSLHIAQADYTPNVTLGSVKFTHDVADDNGNGYTVNLVSGGGVGSLVKTTDTSTVLTYTFGTAITWEDLVTAVNSAATYVTAELVGDDATLTADDADSGVMSGGEWGAHSVSYPMGWEERIVLGMARRALIKEESDTRAVDSEIMLWESRIEEACWSRVMTNVPSVRNSDRETYGWSDRLSLPPFAGWTWP